MNLDLATVAKIVDGELDGVNVLVTGIGIPLRAHEGDLLVVKEQRLLARALATGAAAFIVGPEIGQVDRPCVRVASPVQALVRLLNHVGQAPAWGEGESGVSADAHLGQDVTLGDGVWVGANATIGSHVTVGDRVRIAANAVIGHHVTIGDDTLICPNATIYPRISIGRRVIIHAGAVIGADGFSYEEDEGVIYKVPSMGTVVIEDDVEIGANTCIDRAAYGVTRIGRSSKLDNLVMIAHDVEVGERCGFVGYAGVAGDSTVGYGTVLMARGTILDNVLAAPHTLVMASSVVTRDTEEGETYSGFPALPHEEQKRIWRALRRLPELVERLEGQPETGEGG